MKLNVVNLVKDFEDVRAVDHLSFSISAGDITGFVGPNGAGKTTTLRMLATVEEPTSGLIELDKTNITDHPEKAHEVIGFVPDSLHLQADMSVHEYLDFFARAYGIRGSKRRVLLDELEEFTDLTGIREKLLTSLSKGMKQRVSIARALIHDPAFLLMDEPAAGLDPRARIELRELLRLLAAKGKGILISSHILSELSEICSRIMFIERGRLLKFGSMEDVTDEHSLDKVRRLIVRSLNSLDAVENFVLQYPQVENIIRNGQTIEFDFSGDDLSAAELLHTMVKKDLGIAEFKFKQHDLESVFMSITKGEVQ